MSHPVRVLGGIPAAASSSRGSSSMSHPVRVMGVIPAAARHMINDDDYTTTNNHKRPLTPKSMPPAGDEHAKLKT